MPSGMLCKVIAKYKLSFLYLINLSQIGMKKLPTRIPMQAGSQAIIPCASAISIDGIIRDQQDAAIITPLLNPKKILLNF